MTSNVPSSYLVLLTTQTADTVDLVNLQQLLLENFTASTAPSPGTNSNTSKGDTTAAATPTGENNNSDTAAAASSSIIHFDRTYTSEHGDGSVEYVEQVLASLPEDKSSVCIIVTPTMVVAEALLKASGKHQHLVGTCVTINATETLPLSAASGSPVGKGGKKPDPKKDAKKKDKNAPAEVERAIKVSEDIMALAEAGNEMAARMSFVNVTIPTASSTETVLASEVIPELKSAEDDFTAYLDWAKEKRTETIPSVDAPIDIRSCATAMKWTADSSNKWSIGVVLMCLVAQAAANTAISSQPKRFVQKIDLQQKLKMEIEAERVAAAATSAAGDESKESTPEKAKQEGAAEDDETNRNGAPTAAEAAQQPVSGPFFEVQDRPDITKETDHDEILWLVQSQVKDVLGMDCPGADMFKRDAKDAPSVGLQTAEEVESQLLDIMGSFISAQQMKQEMDAQDYQASLERKEERQRTMGSSDDEDEDNDKDNGLMKALPPSTAEQLIDQYVGSGGELDNPVVESELIAAIEKNLTPREVKFVNLQVLLQQLIQEQFPHLIDFNLNSHIYVELLSRAEFIAEVARYNLLGNSPAEIVTVPCDQVATHGSMGASQAKMQSTNLAHSSRSVLSEANVVDRSAPTAVTVVGNRIPPNTSKLTSGRRRQYSLMVALCGIPTFYDFYAWQEGGSESRYAPLLNNTVFLESSDQNKKKNATKVAEMHAEEIYPYDGSTVQLNHSADSKRITVTRDDLVCGLRSTKGQHYFTASFDDNVTASLSINNNCSGADASVDTVVSGKDVTLRLDETEGNVEMTFSTWRQQLLEVFCPLTQRVLTRPEFEQSRRIANDTATVFRYMASGVIQILFANGNVCTMTRGADGAKYSLTTRSDGRRFLKVTRPAAKVAPMIAVDSVASPEEETIKSTSSINASRQQSPKNAPVAPEDVGEQQLQSNGGIATPDVASQELLPPVELVEELSPVEVKPAVDLENDCKIFSRADGTMIVEYRHVSEMSIGRSQDAAQRRVHTRVVVHADGTNIVSFLSAISRASTPMLAPLADEQPYTADAGTKKFVVETPSAPKVIFLVPQAHAEKSNVHAVCIPFGDGTLLKRHYPLSDVSDNLSASMVTILARPTESTIRINHFQKIIFVEPFSTQLSDKTPTTIAINEGSWCFDYIHGVFRTVDYKRCVLEITHCFTVNPNDYGGEFDVQWNAQTTEVLLVNMAPAGYNPHAVPKRVKDLKDEELEKQDAEKDRSHLLCDFPPLEDRLRDMVKTFVVEQKLIGKRGAPPAGATKRDAAATANDKSVKPPSTMVPATHIDPTKPLNLLKAPEDKQRNRIMLESDRRPLTFIERDDGSVLRLMCASDLLAYVHRKSSLKEAIVSRSQVSGEPGVQQIAFSVVGAARQALEMTHQRSVLFATGAPAGTMAKFESTAQPSSAAPSWLPQSLLPIRRAKDKKANGASQRMGGTAGADAITEVVDIPPANSAIERQVIRYAPTSEAIRLMIARQLSKKFQRNEQMEAYGKTLEKPDTRTDEERHQEHLVRCNHASKLREFADALSATGNNLQAVCTQDDEETTDNRVPSRERVVESRDGQTTVMNFDAATPNDMSAGDVHQNDANHHLGAATGMTPHGGAATPGRTMMGRSNNTHHMPQVQVTPQMIDFGKLPTRFKYSMILTLNNLTTNAIFFTVRRTKRKGSPISVQSGKGLLSPKASATVVVVASMSEDVIGAVGVNFEEILHIEVEGSKNVVRVPVVGIVAATDDTYSVKRDVKVLGPV